MLFCARVLLLCGLLALASAGKRAGMGWRDRFAVCWKPVGAAGGLAGRHRRSCRLADSVFLTRFLLLLLLQPP